MRNYILLLIVALFITFSGVMLIKENKRLKNENKRYFSNMLKMGTDVLITKDELLRSKAELGTMQLTAREFERLNDINKIDRKYLRAHNNGYVSILV